MSGVQGNNPVNDNYNGNLYVAGDNYNDIQIRKCENNTVVTVDEFVANAPAQRGENFHRRFPTIEEAKKVLKPGEQLIVKRDDAGNILDMAIRRTVNETSTAAMIIPGMTITSAMGILGYALMVGLKGIGASFSAAFSLIPMGMLDQTPTA